uniref:Uncharacterized protein n=1 Tax=Chromera velia CCMP2878 TaxID=1169474 RepID=A0A0G4FYE2_9ALVE|mmetsp:Transcript_33040/g.65498  ORF Transcript_33040/g.65498 Transcript_33040/m.65498 type:complete len:374 (+) Transcript_33040:112-1233(+)|eukprot:Cvel_19394.t1-p1 / transcript=Cvel_19394.t1 / gene=Cvel_19394 / organism=Chromera_velia_CCMP2878 / gene_product=hypothetical protein / transcript_product=hypothetical protein / location=Cvel_scaffold1668:20972-24507(-) / protein_length=373 / sequence_SO=supercontig / SO=protein_coding / is_pseudo=false
MGRQVKGSKGNKRAKNRKGKSKLSKPNLTAERYVERSNKIGFQKSANKAPALNDDAMIRSVFGDKIDVPSTTVRGSSSKKERKKAAQSENSDSVGMVLMGGSFQPFKSSIKKATADTKLRDPSAKKSAVSKVKKEEGESMWSFKKRLREAVKEDDRTFSVKSQKKKDKWKEFNDKKKQKEVAKKEKREEDKQQKAAEEFRGRDVVAFGDVVEQPPEGLQRLAAKFRIDKTKSQKMPLFGSVLEGKTDGENEEGGRQGNGPWGGSRTENKGAAGSKGKLNQGGAGGTSAAAASSQSKSGVPQPPQGTAAEGETANKKEAPELEAARPLAGVKRKEDRAAEKERKRKERLNALIQETIPLKPGETADDDFDFGVF